MSLRILRGFTHPHAPLAMALQISKYSLMHGAVDGSEKDYVCFTLFVCLNVTELGSTHHCDGISKGRSEIGLGTDDSTQNYRIHVLTKVLL